MSGLAKGINDNVVPRKGDVDRNDQNDGAQSKLTSSSPARGTWIEITEIARSVPAVMKVVPRKGDVDRNIKKSELARLGLRRPPQGGRG